MGSVYAMPKYFLNHHQQITIYNCKPSSTINKSPLTTSSITFAVIKTYMNYDFELIMIVIVCIHILYDNIS